MIKAIKFTIYYVLYAHKVESSSNPLQTKSKYRNAINQKLMLTMTTHTHSHYWKKQAKKSQARKQILNFDHFAVCEKGTDEH